MKEADCIYLVSKKLYSDWRCSCNRIDFYDITSNSELSSFKCDIVSFILHEDKSSEYFIPVIVVSHIDCKCEFSVILRGAYAVDA